MNKEEIKNMSREEIIEQLKWSDPYEFSYDYAFYALEKIDKLNNIINELGKYLIEMSDRSWNDNGAYDDVLDKLKELRENNKS